MWKDPIVEEIHKIREEHAEEYDFDLAAIVRALQEEEKAQEHRIVRLATIEPVRKAANGGGTNDSDSTVN